MPRAGHRSRKWFLLGGSGGSIPAAPLTAPTDLSGCIAWWDGADVSTLFTGAYADRLTSTTNPTTNGDPLCRHDDKSGNGNPLTCVADATRPTYDLVSLLNGKPAATLGIWGCPVFTGNEKTWFHVHRYNGNTADTRLNRNSPSLVSLGISAATSWRLSFVRDGVAWIDSGFTQGTSARIYRVQYVVGGNSTFWTAASGVETQRQTTALVGSGSPGTTASINLPGQHYETFVYDRVLTAGEITRVHTYLTTKWGV